MSRRFVMPTDTRFIRIESRQYELLNMKINRGIPRKAFYVYLAVGAAWLALTLGVLRTYEPMIILVPPALICMFATRKDRSERYAYLAWWDWIRLARRRRAPLVPQLGQDREARRHRAAGLPGRIRTDLAVSRSPITVTKGP